MKPKSIGIVGGAGPLAGASLLERIISLAGSLYGCYKDADFPKILLLSFPFSEMLTTDINIPRLQKELYECLHQLRQNGAAVLAIACNTLHAFLDESEVVNNLIHMPRLVATEIAQTENPLVLCTSTSRQFEVHKHFFPCVYPDLYTQFEIDKIIEDILKGIDRELILNKLAKLIENQNADTILLGCTELSLFTKDLTLCNKLVIDPLDIVAKKILEISFLNN